MKRFEQEKIPPGENGGNAARTDNVMPGEKVRVLLLGDSIRINYQNSVRENLGGEFEVRHPEDNGRFAKYTLNELDRWFGACGEPDVIHWNNGLWDSSVVCREDGMFTPPEEYLSYMKKILRELRKHSGHVIFATTTPVRRDGDLRQYTENIERLNDVIVPYMREQRVPVNDLYALLKGQREECLMPDGIHLTPGGCRVCGQAVAEIIRAELGMPAGIPAVQ